MKVFGIALSLFLVACDDTDLGGFLFVSLCLLLIVILIKTYYVDGRLYTPQKIGVKRGANTKTSRSRISNTVRKSGLPKPLVIERVPRDLKDRAFTTSQHRKQYEKFKRRFEDLPESSPLSYFKYRVGRTSPLSVSDRRDCLLNCFLGEIPDVFSAAERSKWGTPNSSERFRQMVRHLEGLIHRSRNRRVQAYANEDWRQDKDWFEEFVGVIGNYTSEDFAGYRFKTSLLTYFGYRVGRSNRLNLEQRRRCLIYAYKNEMPDTLPVDERKKWGPAATRQRLEGMIVYLNSLVSMCNDLQAMKFSVKTWQKDIEWLSVALKDYPNNQK